MWNLIYIYWTKQGVSRIDKNLKGHGQRSYRADLDTSFHVLKKDHCGLFSKQTFRNLLQSSQCFTK